jgi:hypothetical protein
MSDDTDMDDALYAITRAITDHAPVLADMVNTTKATVAQRRAYREGVYLLLLGLTGQSDQRTGVRSFLRQR